MVDHSDVKKILAHRYPMLLVDRIESLEPWERVVGIKCVTGTDPCYANISDDAPIASYAYPPSLMIEAFGQACGIFVGKKRLHDGRPTDELMIAASVMQFDVLHDVFPGDQMEFHGRMFKEMTDFAVFDGEVIVRGREVALIENMIVAFRRPNQLTADEA